MLIRARCACGHAFQVEPELAGGLANCPRCGQATQVEGLRDPFWRVIQAAALVAWVIVVALVFTSAGLVGALLAGAGLAAVYWLIWAFL